MGIDSINEPGQRTTMLTPVSINEPVSFETPVVSALSPDQCVVGDPDFTLVVSGSGFFAGSVINFAGHDEPTTFNEDGTLSTGVKPSLWQDPVFTFAGSTETRGALGADPDELEDEIDEAEDDGDFRSTHPRRRKR
jgi:hypothetical protein